MIVAVIVREKVHVNFYLILNGYQDTAGHAGAQLVEALRYEPKSHGFDSRWCHWNFSWKQSFRPHYGPGVGSASNRNNRNECVELTTLPASCVDCF